MGILQGIFCSVLVVAISRYIRRAGYRGISFAALQSGPCPSCRSPISPRRLMRVDDRAAMHITTIIVCLIRPAPRSSSSAAPQWETQALIHICGLHVIQSLVNSLHLLSLAWPHMHVCYRVGAWAGKRQGICADRSLVFSCMITP